MHLTAAVWGQCSCCREVAARYAVRTEYSRAVIGAPAAISLLKATEQEAWPWHLCAGPALSWGSSSPVPLEGLQPHMPDANTQ